MAKKKSKTHQRAKDTFLGNSFMGEDDSDLLWDPLGWKSNLMANSDEEDAKAEDWHKKALAEAEGLTAPDLTKLDLDEYDWLGDYTPPDQVDARLISKQPDLTFEDLVAERMGPSAFEGISTDPRLRGKQDAALAALEELAAGGGLNAKDRANLARIQGQEQQADRGRREAILSNARQRGMSGSGLELLAQLDSSQAATDRQSQQDMDVAGMAEERALDAIMRGGELAGGIRNQDFGEQARIAAAKDAINQFNTNNMNDFSRFNADRRLDVGRYNRDSARGVDEFNANMGFNADRTNAGFKNDAAFESWRGLQGNSDRNTGVRNQVKQYNQVQLPQQRFENDAHVRGVKGKAYGNEAGYWGGKANAIQAKKAATQGGIMQIVGTVGGGMLGGPGGAKAGNAAGQSMSNAYQQPPQQNQGYGDDDEELYYA